ncbi:Protein CBG24600, partial [Caenorhabditis briggsae]
KALSGLFDLSDRSERRENRLKLESPDSTEPGPKALHTIPPDCATQPRLAESAVGRNSLFRTSTSDLQGLYKLEKSEKEVRVVTSFQGIWDASSPKATTSATNLVRSRDAIGDQGTRPMAGRQMLGSRSCAAHDSSKRITGGSSSNGQAGEQPIWLDHGMCQQHRMMGGGRMLGNCACAVQCYFFFFVKLIGVIKGSWDPMDGSSTRMTGGSSANGQAEEQPIWLDHECVSNAG